MAYYSVNQGKTYDKEFKQGILWAPTWDKANHQQAHCEFMRKVRPGDISSAARSKRYVPLLSPSQTL